MSSIDLKNMIVKIKSSIRRLLGSTERILVVYDGGYLAALSKQTDIRRFNQLVRFYAGSNPYRSVWFGTRNPNGFDDNFFHILSSINIEAKLYRLAKKETSCPSCDSVSVREIQKGVDVGLAIFIMKEMAGNRFDKLVLIAGDGDFLDLAHEVRQSGCKINILGTPETVSESLRGIVDRVIDITDTLPLCKRGRLTPEEEHAWRQIMKAIP